MKTNKEKFLDLVSTTKNNSAAKNKERIAKRAMLRESRAIAFKVLEKLDELNWSQKTLALAMEVSPQYVNKLVKGKENFTLETQIKLQQILDIPILASYYENKKRESKHFEGEGKIAIAQTVITTSYQFTAFVSSKKNYNSGSYTSNHCLQAC